VYVRVPVLEKIKNFITFLSQAFAFWDGFGLGFGQYLESSGLANITDAMIRGVNFFNHD